MLLPMFQLGKLRLRETNHSCTVWVGVKWEPRSVV